MRPLEPNVQIYVKTMRKLEMHWHIFLTRTVAFCLVKQTAHLQVVYMQSVLPLGASNLLSKSSEIWEQLCSEPTFYSLHFLSSASSSVDKRLSTDFTWQPAASRARNRKPTLRPSQITCQSQSLKFPIAGQTRWSERGCWWVGPRLTLGWWLRLRQGSRFESPSPLPMYQTQFCSCSLPRLASRE